MLVMMRVFDSFNSIRFPPKKIRTAHSHMSDTVVAEEGSEDHRRQARQSPGCRWCVMPKARPPSTATPALPWSNRSTVVSPGPSIGLHDDGFAQQHPTADERPNGCVSERR